MILVFYTVLCMLVFFKDLQEYFSEIYRLPLHNLILAQNVCQLTERLPYMVSWLHFAINRTTVLIEVPISLSNGKMQILNNHTELFLTEIN